MILRRIVECWSRVVDAGRRRQMEREADREIDAHLDLLTMEYIRRGFAPEEARRRARVRFGGVTQVKESLRDQAGFPAVESVAQDVRYGLRSLGRAPVFTTVAVGILALGIGVNAAVFSLVNVVLLRPLPVSAPEALVGVYNRHTEPPGDYRAFSYPTFLDVREHTTALSDVIGHVPTIVRLEEDGVSRRLQAYVVSDRYFEAFGDVLASGRGFSVEESTPNANIPVAIVSHAFWERRGRDPDLLGRDLRINGIPFTIVAIARPGFIGASTFVGPELWLPLGVFATAVTDRAQPNYRDLSDRANHTLVVVGRLRPGTTRQAAAAELAALGTTLAEAFPAVDADHTITTGPLSTVGASIRPEAGRQLRLLGLLLSLMAAIVLLVACLNLSNMMFASGHARRREIAVRLSLGARRGRVVRQLLTEGLLLSLAGGVGGLLVARWLVHTIVVSMVSRLPIGVALSEMGLDGRVVGVTLGFSVLATLGFGLAPAWRLAGRGAGDLKPRDDGVGLRGRALSGPNLLVVGQLALSLALLIPGGLFLRGALIAADRSPGFALEHGLLAEIDLAGYDESRGLRTYAALLRRLLALPGVEAAAAASFGPFSGLAERRPLQPVGRPDADDDRLTPRFDIVTPGYFGTVGLPILRGRDFTDGDSRSDSRVVIVDEPLVRRLWPVQDPLGAYVAFYNSATGQRDDVRQVVGVVPGVRSNAFDADVVAHVYAPFGHPYRSTMTIHLATGPGGEAAARALLPVVREALRTVDPELPILSLTTLQDHLDADPALLAIGAAYRAFLTFGVAALLMAVIGIYGVRSHVVARRTREVGVRRALGATSGDVLRLLVGDGLRLTAVGLVVGLALALPLGHILQRWLVEISLDALLVEVSATDPIVFAVTPLMLSVVAVAASYLPARRAARIAPMTALRHE